eukprot:420293-Prorocentrum_minimum.AAC.1
MNQSPALTSACRSSYSSRRDRRLPKGTPSLLALPPPSPRSSLIPPPASFSASFSASSVPSEMQDTDLSC